MEIPAVVFIVIGVLVAAFSVYINIIQKSFAMSMFVVAGIALVIWGVIKLKSGT